MGHERGRNSRHPLHGFAFLAGLGAAITVAAGQQASAVPVFELSTPVLVAELNSPTWDWTPWVSPDGLEIYFASDRDDRPTMYHIYRCTRSEVGEPFGPPVRVSEINHPPRQHDPCLSADALVMYFTSWRPGGTTDLSVWSITRTHASLPFDSSTQQMVPAVNSNDPLEANEGAWVSSDGLRIYFDRINIRNPVRDCDIYYAWRESLNDPFSTPVAVSEVNLNSYDRYPYLTADELVMFFGSDRPGGVGLSDIYVAVRPSRDEPFGPPVNLMSVNSPFHEKKPIYHEATQTLYFCSNRPGGMGQYDVYACRLVISLPPVFSEPVAVAELNSNAMDFAPWLSADGLEVYLASDRGASTDQYHIYHSTRTNIDAPFSGPVLVAEVNQGVRQADPFVTDDFLTMYFGSNSPGVTIGEWSIWEIKRGAADLPWDSATQRLLPGPHTPGVFSNNSGPCLTADRLTMFFHSTRAGSGACDLFRCARSSTSEEFGPAVPVQEFNSSALEGWPYITRDGLMFFFTSGRAGGRGGFDLYLAMRESPSEPFGPPINLHTICSEHNEIRPVFHEASGTLYFSSDRNGNYDVFACRLIGTPSLPRIAVAPTSIEVTAEQFLQTGTTVTETLEIWNSGGGTLVYEATASPSDYLRITPASGETTGVANRHVVSIFVWGTQVGNYEGQITVSGNAVNSPVLIPVQITIVTPAPTNLTVSSVDVAPTAPVHLAPGDPVVLAAFIENQGPGRAGAFWAEVWGSRSGGLTLDYFLAPSLALDRGLAAGQAFSWITTAPLYSIPDGRYSVVYAVDRPGQVAETNERDNRAAVAGKSILILRPTTNVDLAVESFGLAPNPALSGGPIMLSGRVVNSGTEPSGPFWIEFWGSWAWPYPAPGFMLCDSIFAANLEPGAVIDLANYERQLYAVPVGIFQVGCTVDRQDVISEMDETNNYQFTDGQIFNHPWPLERETGEQTVGADIVVLAADFITSPSGESSSPGDALTCAVTLENASAIETGPFWLEFWGSRDGGMTVSDLLGDSLVVGTLAPQQQVTLVWRARLYSIPDGPYSLTVWADRPNDVGETNERNNRLTVAGKRISLIRPQTGANLVLKFFSVTTKMNGSVENTGSADSGPFWIEFWAAPGDPDYPVPYYYACDSICVGNLGPAQSLYLGPYERRPYESLPPGVYAIICYADGRDQVVEADETDNYRIERQWQSPP